ncbi:MAG: HIT domain-containing protein [Lachnospiraceae bacterium]|nr:HIT domain-containing protein [Lachnospiraceae bacterium]
MKDDCIFCKLANGVFPTNKIYEDEDFAVILDLGPAAKGHALILPKEHYANIYEIPEELLAKAAKLAKRMAAHMTEKLSCDGFNIVQNNGEVAGQTVFHFHIHLIPRYKNDNQKIGWKPGKPSEEELARLGEELKLS